jgi:uncharacterized protein (DUF488 family)
VIGELVTFFYVIVLALKCRNFKQKNYATMEFYTIGVYHSTEKDFFDKLIKNKIDTFCDIRQRRGVRGSKYAFANSTRLQNKLHSLGIKYVYVSGLAPTTEIRELQYQVDDEKGERKSERTELGKAFATEYKKVILANFDFKQFFEELESMGAKRITFFCVEELAEACHRSIVTDKLAKTYKYKIKHL